MTLQTMMIPAVLIVQTVQTAALHQTAAIPTAVLPEVAAQAPPEVLQAEAAVPVAPAAPVAVLQVLHLLQNQVHRMMIPQAPVIREMMTEMN